MNKKRLELLKSNSTERIILKIEFFEDYHKHFLKVLDNPDKEKKLKKNLIKLYRFKVGFSKSVGNYDVFSGMVGFWNRYKNFYK